LKFKLNKALPDDIAIHDIIQVDDKSHAQFHATERTYDYYIHTRKMPFLSEISVLYEEKIDSEKMKMAATILPKYQDFHAFCKTPDKHNHTICHIKSTELFVDESREKIRFQITSNRFEYHLKSKERPQFTNFAPPQGLFLSEVKYPFLP